MSAGVWEETPTNRAQWRFYRCRECWTAIAVRRDEEPPLVCSRCAAARLAYYADNRPTGLERYG